MSIRTLVAAICVAGLAAGSAVTQARAGVQPSVQRTGSATVDSNVDAVSALTSLSGTFSWWLYLSNGEVTALTNPSIHVAPPSGPAPPGTSAATLAAGDSLQDNLPPVPAVVTPEFDSSRVVSPGVADPGTHRQTVTITWTPQTFPLGYSESWGYVRIDGLSTATNSAVVSAPGSAVVDDTGTNRLYIGYFGLLPQTQYTMQVTFDVTNPGSTSVPYKPRVTISESFGADLTATPAQQSYAFSDPDLGTTTWSVDQNVVWLPRMFRNTTVAYTPVSVVSTPTAQAYDARTAYLELPSATDSLSATSTYTGWRTWYASIGNTSALTVPAPQISVDRSSQTFTPPVTFPLSSGVGADLTAQYQSLAFSPLSGRSYGNAQVDGIPVTTGFDLTRTESPATLPAGGGTQDVTVTFVPRDPSYAHKAVSLVVQADAGLPPSVRPATIVPGSVTSESAGQYEPAPAQYTDYVTWYPSDLVVGRTYTLRLQIAVSSSSNAAFPYKPHVLAAIETHASNSTAAGRSTTIDDDVLGGTFTFTAGADVYWSLYASDFTTAILDPINPPQLSYVYTYINSYNVASEPADVDSVGAGTTVTGVLTWYAAMCNTTPTYFRRRRSPSTRVRRRSPHSCRSRWARLADLARANACLALKLDGGSPNSSVVGVPTSTGYDVSRTMSPETIAPGGDTQTVHVSITPRDSRYEQVFLEVTTGAVQGAQIDTSSVVWPTLGAGEQAAGPPQPAYVISINNPVVGKTYTLTLQIHVPNSTSVSRTYKPGIYIGGGLHVNVDASGPPPNGASTSVHDDVLGGTFTFSLGTPARWTHNLWRQYALSIDSLWSGAPNGHIGVYRTTQVAPDASSDSVDGTQTLPGTLSWTAYIWNYGSDAITSPTISLDASSQTFTPPVTFPLSTTGGNLQHYDTLWLDQLDGYTGHSQVDVNGLTTGLDATRTMTPRAIPPGGGTQTVTVSITVRDPQTAGGSVSIDVTPGDLVLGAVVDPSSVVWPTADPNASPYTYIAPDGSDAYWSLPTSTLNKTYNLTLQIHVPNGTATALQYKPKVTAEAAPPLSIFRPRGATRRRSRTTSLVARSRSAQEPTWTGRRESRSPTPTSFSHRSRPLTRLHPC